MVRDRASLMETQNHLIDARDRGYLARFALLAPDEPGRRGAEPPSTSEAG
jgi:hypothetical protein